MHSLFEHVVIPAMVIFCQASGELITHVAIHPQVHQLYKLLRGTDFDESMMMQYNAGMS
jgi:hypothetical protein